LPDIFCGVDSKSDVPISAVNISARIEQAHERVIRRLPSETRECWQILRPVVLGTIYRRDARVRFGRFRDVAVVLGGGHFSFRFKFDVLFFGDSTIDSDVNRENHW
jgi:hypothetical protein